MLRRYHLKQKILSVIVFLLLLAWTLLCQAQSSVIASNDSQFIAEQKAKEAAITAPYANEVTQLAATAQKNAQAPDIQAYIHQLQENSQALLNSSSVDQPALSAGHILVFVSASMPPASLQQWFNQVQKIHAAFILRGLVNNSVPDTKKWVKQLMEKNNRKGGIQVDPVAFERYDIQQVPAVVAINRNIQCPPSMSCITPPFDVVYGNINLFDALQIIVNKGEVANGVAQTALNQMRKSRD